MLGILVVAENDDVSMMVVPDPLDSKVLLVFVQYGDIEFPSIPLPISDLKQVLEVLDGNKKANGQTPIQR